MEPGTSFLPQEGGGLIGSKISSLFILPLSLIGSLLLFTSSLLLGLTLSLEVSWAALINKSQEMLLSSGSSLGERISEFLGKLKHKQQLRKEKIERQEKVIVTAKAKEQSKDLEERLKQINTMQDDALREKAEVELLKKHPDFVTIRDQDEFHTWVEEQPEWVQKALYENEHDANSAARAIDLYKADMGISTKKVTAKDKSLDAAKSVATNKGNPNTSSEVGTLRESDVEKMSSREYEANQEEITKAIQSGKFIYDLTGSAR